MKKKFIIFLLLFCFIWNDISAFALETKYPDYAYEFLGVDKWENTNRKIFSFNQKLNKYAICPIHTIWSSIMPKYAMDRLNGISNNIEYPIRLISSLIQRDFKTSKNETVRFLTNSTLGLGGMFDPAKHFFHIEQSKENMEQALEKCKLKSGPFFVMPVLSFTNIRGILGKLLDMALNPSCYIGSPILAIIKSALTVNRTTYLQPLLQMVESNYADPYEITKKAFAIDSYIKKENMDRVEVISSLQVPVQKEIIEQEKNIDKNVTNSEKKEINKQVSIEVSSEILSPNLLYGGTIIDEMISPNYSAENFILDADMKLSGYNPQNPVVDSMRTALFSLPGVDDSIWNELSVWNRSFSHRIKTSSIPYSENRDNYKYRYILQKNKKSPLVIIYPSIGEGIMSSHSVTLGKLFYDAGYSVLIQGSHFQWEFVKSMPKGYYPGLPAKDSMVLRTLTKKIIDHLEKKYGYEFESNILIGTSFGALITLFIASEEEKNNTLGNTKFISICPPIDLIYAMKQIDKNSEEWNKSSQDLKQRVALTASKIVKLYQNKQEIDFEVNNLPFDEEEGKLITGFIMHQKLSDLIFTIEEAPKTSGSDIYNTINNMGYQDYTKKYLLSKEDETCDDLSFETGLIAISNYLEHGSNYKIYHSVNDYLTNKAQLKKLKQITGNRTTLLDNGSHLGFLYRKEFIDSLKETIALNNVK